MLEKILALLMWFASGLALCGQTVQLPPGFAFEKDFVTGLDQPTDLRFSPDGRIFITEKSGKVRVVENGFLLEQPFYEVQTQTPYERGLDGIVLDPNFDDNGYVYLYHTLPFENRNRVIRVTAMGNTALPGSELELIRFDQLYAAFHNGGSMVFDTTGCLIIGVGDGTGWFIAQDNQVTLGKMLRIHADGSIPTDNPFYNQFQGQLRAIAAYGVRNPYTMDISRTTGRILFNDVGNLLFEEINEFQQHANYGWGLVEGMLGNANPPDSNYVDPLHVYNHQFGCAVVGAAFYEPLVQVFPQEYFGKFFFIEYCQGLILSLDPDSGSVTQFGSGLGTYYNNIETGPDGALYLIHVANGNVARISYQGLNAAPLISQQPKPLVLQRYEKAVFDVIANGLDLQYEWFLNDSMVQSGTVDSLVLKQVDLPDDGSRIYVRISNGNGSLNSDTVPLTVVDGTPPYIRFQNMPTTYSAGDTVRFGAMVTDADQTTVPTSDWTWQVVFHHDEHGHPTLPPTSGTDRDSFFVESFGEVDTNVFFRVHLTVRDSSGLTTHRTRDVLPEKVTMQIASIPEGVEINVDGTHVQTPVALRSLRNQKRTIGFPFATVVGDSLYQFEEWWDHQDSLTRTFSATNHILTARYAAQARYFTGVQDSGTLEIYRDTASAQQWYSTRRVPHIRENWDILSPYPFDPQFSSTNWSTRWKGWIFAPMTGDYTFYLMHDGKTTLYLDGRQLLQETTPWQQVWVDTVHVQLEGNRRYWLELDYDHYTEVSRVEFDWEYSIVKRHTVPFMDPAELEIIPPAHEYGDILLFPNPITDATLNLWVNENEFGTAAVDLRIYDLAGRQFLRYVGKPGSEIQPIDLSRLETGIYIARVTVGIEERVVRLMKL